MKVMCTVLSMTIISVAHEYFEVKLVLSQQSRVYVSDINIHRKALQTFTVFHMPQLKYRALGLKAILLIASKNGISKGLERRKVRDLFLKMRCFSFLKHHHSFIQNLMNSTLFWVGTSIIRIQIHKRYITCQNAGFPSLCLNMMLMCQIKGTNVLKDEDKIRKLYSNMSSHNMIVMFDYRL